MESLSIPFEDAGVASRSVHHSLALLVFHFGKTHETIETRSVHEHRPEIMARSIDVKILPPIQGTALCQVFGRPGECAQKL